MLQTLRAFCSAQHMQLLPWPTYSPDMSHIEHMWDLVGRRLARDPRSVASKNYFCWANKQYGILFHRQAFKICLTPCHVAQWAVFPFWHSESPKMKLREIKKKQPTIYGPHRFPSHVVNSFRQYVNGDILQ
ncbi:uncharacterized protein TNCV_4666671 [Trichonephila clavipes]|nr:uncharacterized protein TNCV_4666671 [Trichonephila clavipes]